MKSKISQVRSEPTLKSLPLFFFGNLDLTAFANIYCRDLEQATLVLNDLQSKGLVPMVIKKIQF